MLYSDEMRKGICYIKEAAGELGEIVQYGVSIIFPFFSLSVLFVCFYEKRFIST